jgi:hypothetical protein
VRVCQFDAFAKIDGGGSGRSASDDKRIELAEWLAGYKGVTDHGFVGLEGISTKEEAKEVFGKIDDNGGGIVLLDEWSFFLKNCEIAADTALGKLLAADEARGVGKKEALYASERATLKELEAVPMASEKPPKEAVPDKAKSPPATKNLSRVQSFHM